MTARKEALQELLDAVRAGDGPGNHVFCLETIDQIKWAVDAWRGSLDAFVALLKAALPGWWWTRPDGAEMGIIRIVGPDNGDCYPSSVGRNPDPARAGLIAILKALIAMEGDE